MSYNEDEDLLNSDLEEGNPELSPFSENSVTAIISDSSSDENEEKEEVDEETPSSRKPKAFTDKDNEWIKLKNSNEEEEEDDGMEEESEEEEKVLLLCWI